MMQRASIHSFKTHIRKTKNLNLSARFFLSGSFKHSIIKKDAEQKIGRFNFNECVSTDGCTQSVVHWRSAKQTDFSSFKAWFSVIFFPLSNLSIWMRVPLDGMKVCYHWKLCGFGFVSTKKKHILCHFDVNMHMEFKPIHIWLKIKPNSYKHRTLRSLFNFWFIWN